MTATLGDVLLVFLADRPGTWHELQQRHADTFGPADAVDIARVMATVRRQERVGYAESLAVSPRGRRVYGATEAGRRRRRSWLLTVPDDPAVDDIVVRVLPAMVATDRATFDAVIEACLSALRSQRLRPAPVISVGYARARYEDAMASSLRDWLRHLRGRPRERDTAA